MAAEGEEEVVVVVDEEIAMNVVLENDDVCLLPHTSVRCTVRFPRIYIYGTCISEILIVVVTATL